MEPLLMSEQQQLSASDILLSTTDLDSRIKYANKTFCDIAGFSLQELEGQPHNIVRHSDMPKAAFSNLWSFIQQGKSWMGPVKNRCKNGDYYWVNGFVTPIKDEKGDIHEYQSVRTILEEDVQSRAEKVYEALSSGKSVTSSAATKDISLWIQCILIMMTLLTGSHLFWAVSLAASLMFVLALLGLALFIPWRNRYLRVVKEARQVFDNPLMTYLYTGTNDNLGTIELAFKKRQAEIQAIVGRVSDISQSITLTAKESSNSGHNISATLSQQHHETQSVAAASNEMSATVQEINHTVNQAADVTNQGLENSHKGQIQVNQTIDAIEQLSNQLSDVDESINHLTDGCRSIESVSKEISGIAEQTNLLALNAAIEAARAGELGRGFSVVADEVRALAQRTQHSTKEIDNLLNQLVKESDSAIEAMAKGNALSNECVTLSKQTGRYFSHVHDEVSDIAAMSTRISEAMTQQTQAAEEVNQNVIAISDLSTQSERYGLEGTELSLHLLSKIEEQQRLVTQFQRC